MKSLCCGYLARIPLINVSAASSDGSTWRTTANGATRTLALLTPAWRPRSNMAVTPSRTRRLQVLSVCAGFLRVGTTSSSARQRLRPGSLYLTPLLSCAREVPEQ